MSSKTKLIKSTDRMLVPNSNCEMDHNLSHESISKYNDENPELQNIIQRSNTTISFDSETSEATDKSQRFVHHLRKTIEDFPELISLCIRYIKEENTDALAEIARKRGLPQGLRWIIWPLLLRDHPYVLFENIQPEYPDEKSCQDFGLSVENTNDPVPIKRIKGEINRYRQKELKKLELRERANNSTFNGLTHIINNDTAINLENTTSIENNSNNNDTFTKSDAYSFSSYINSSSINNNNNYNTTFSNNSRSSSGASSPLNQYVEVDKDNVFSEIENAVVKFLEKWGHTVKYEAGLVHVAIALSDWYHLRRPKEHAHLSFILETNSSTNNISKDPDFADLSFCKTYERFILVILNASCYSEAGPQGPYDSPLAKRIGKFLQAFHILFPDLSRYFLEEEILGSRVGGDEWLLWWVKWFGARVWPSPARARCWDLIIGYKGSNPSCTNEYIRNGVKVNKHPDCGNTNETTSNDLNENYSVSTPKSKQDLRNTSNSLQFNLTSFKNNDQTKNDNNDNLLSTPMIHNTTIGYNDMDDSMSLTNTFNSSNIYSGNDLNSSRSTSSLSDTFEAQGLMEPFWNPCSFAEDSSSMLPDRKASIASKGDLFGPLPELHDQWNFICLAMIQPFIDKLEEFETSEIREFLGRVPKIDDMEGVIIEAGELWRAWQQNEEEGTM